MDGPTIHKYLLKPFTPVKMPREATLLSVGEQPEGLMLWAAVYPDQPMGLRTIHVVPTGQQVPVLPSALVGTVQMVGGLVFHIFDGGYA